MFVNGCLQLAPNFATSTYCMFPVASTTALLAQFFTDNGTIIYYVFGVLLVALAALLGLGFAIRHVKRWITGRKA